MSGIHPRLQIAARRWIRQGPWALLDSTWGSSVEEMLAARLQVSRAQATRLVEAINGLAQAGIQTADRTQLEAKLQRRNREIALLSGGLATVEVLPGAGFGLEDRLLKTWRAASTQKLAVCGPTLAALQNLDVPTDEIAEPLRSKIIEYSDTLAAAAEAAHIAEAQRKARSALLDNARHERERVSGRDALAETRRALGGAVLAALEGEVELVRAVLQTRHQLQASAPVDDPEEDVAIVPGWLYVARVAELPSAGPAEREHARSLRERWPTWLRDGHSGSAQSTTDTKTPRSPTPPSPPSPPRKSGRPRRATLAMPVDAIPGRVERHGAVKSETRERPVRATMKMDIPDAVTLAAAAQPKARPSWDQPTKAATPRAPTPPAPAPEPAPKPAWDQPTKAVAERRRPLPKTMQMDIPDVVKLAAAKAEADARAKAAAAQAKAPAKEKLEPVSGFTLENARLRVLAGADEGDCYKLKPGATIGTTDSCTVQLYDDGISPVQARVDLRGGWYWIVQHPRARGTRVAGEDIKQIVLRPGDLIEMGDTTMRFEVGPEE